MLNKLTLVRLKTDQDIYAFLDDQLIYLRNKSMVQEAFVICHSREFKKLSSFLKSNFDDTILCSKVNDELNSYNFQKGYHKFNHVYLLWGKNKTLNLDSFLSRGVFTSIESLTILSLNKLDLLDKDANNFQFKRLGYHLPISMSLNKYPF